jgi:uncharacterized protein (DUF1778 family)
MKTYPLKLSAEEHQRLKDAAWASRMTIFEFIMSAINRQITEQKVLGVE